MKNNQLLTIIQGLQYASSPDGREELIDEMCGVTVLSLQNKNKEDTELLRLALVEEKYHSMCQAPKIGEVYQNFSQKKQFVNQEVLEALIKKIEQEIIREIYQKYDLPRERDITFDDVNLQYYGCEVSDEVFAIPPHVDYKASVELIVILLLDGKSLFYVADDRSCTNEKEIIARKMDLIVMRGYRFQGIEKRPVHYVKRVNEKEGRLTLGFRIFSDVEEDLTTMRKALGKT